MRCTKRSGSPRKPSSYATTRKPSRPDFLLQPGELLLACAGLRVVAYEDGFLASPERFVQRIAAVRLAGASPRHLLGVPPASH